MSYDISLPLFLNKYEKKCYDIKNFQTDEFKRDWNTIKNKYNEDIPSIRLLLEQLIEKRFPASLIKDLFTEHSNKDEIKKNEDLFKWTAAFHGKELINFLYLNMDIKNEQGAVNAAIINFRLDNLKALNDLGINVFNEKNFCQAIARSNQPSSSDIVEYYLENKDKFEIGDYGKKALIAHTELIQWVFRSEKFDMVNYLLEQGVEVNKIDILNIACMDGSLNGVKYILESESFNLLVGNKNLTSTQLDKAFIWAATSDYKDIIDYFINDYNIKYSKQIKAELNLYQLDNIKKLFEIRDLTKALEKELPNHEVTISNKKPKL